MEYRKHIDMAGKRLGWVSLIALLAVSQMVTGCASTRGRRGEPEKSGFLGDYSQLKENPDYPAALVYVKPGVQWSRYNSVQIESAGLWVNEETKSLSPEDQQHLTDVLFSKMFTEMGKVFTVVNQPGPGTLRIRAALTQAQGAKVGLRVVSTIVPQLRMAGGLVGLAGDTATTVGSATAEFEVLDSVTNERLAAAVDSRAGTKVLFAKRSYSTWGDVEEACTRWSARAAWQLARVGVQRKPGVAMPEEPSENRSF
ncbi:MAG TPA: DUF3313 domain-containing protein [Candidatus Acidoferrales bacterium]|nr:DUF3313 domain-containing protein [Candidatus Acidoferrales bacterium]